MTDFAARYQEFFRSQTRSSFDAAVRYLMGLFTAPARTYEAMAAAVVGADAQRFQHFIAESPWDHQPLLAQIARDADRLLGGKPDSCLIIDETAMPKKGEQTVGVARQWCGRLGKVENCQVGVFCVLSDGQRHAFIDERLFLPEAWVSDPYRCDCAGVPRAFQVRKSKAEHALDMVRTARRTGVRFAWVGVDGGYGKDPQFLRGVEEAGEVFVADVHRDQTVWLQDPGLHVPARTGRRGKAPVKARAATAAVTVEEVAARLSARDWFRVCLRDATRGPLMADVATRRVWLWDGKEPAPRAWHLIVRREVGSPKTVKYTLSNAPTDTPQLRLAQMQGHRFWVERALEDAKESCGLADNQGRSWTVWHHHVAMVMLAMLFVLEQRLQHADAVDLLSPGDIVLILKAMLPAPDAGPAAALKQINRRHQKRHAAICSRHRARHERFDPCI